MSTPTAEPAHRARAPELNKFPGARARRISPGDTVKLLALHGPSKGDESSVLLEIWEPGCSQPPSSHPASVETFLFLRGSSVAHGDRTSVAISAGDFIVLPADSVHRIESAKDRPLANTSMNPGQGFAALVVASQALSLNEDELAVLAESPWRPPPLAMA